MKTKISNKIKILLCYLLAFAVVLPVVTLSVPTVHAAESNVIDFENYEVGTITDVDGITFISGDYQIVDGIGDGKVLKGDMSKRIEMDFNHDCAQKTLQYDFMYDGAFTTYGGIYTKAHTAEGGQVGTCVFPSQEKSVTINCNTPSLVRRWFDTTVTAKTWYTIKMKLTADTIYIKFWEAGATEPEVWLGSQNVPTAYTAQNDTTSPKLFIPVNDSEGTFYLDNISVDSSYVTVDAAAVVSPVGAGDISGVGSYRKGDTVTYTAAPKEGYRFVRWQDKNGTPLSTEATYSYVISSATELVAVFERTIFGPLEISSFTANGQTEPAIIDAENKTISVRMASDTDLRNVKGYYYANIDSGLQCDYHLDLSGGEATIGEGKYAWTIKATKNSLMTTLYVNGSKGSDQNDGATKETAFKTIEKAKAAAKAIDNWTGDVKVIVANGEYVLNETLHFGTEDGAEKGYALIFQGEEQGKTVISSGIEVNNWTQLTAGTAPSALPSATASNVWVADVPAGITYSRDMYVDGTRATLAKTATRPTTAELAYIPYVGYTASGTYANMANWRNISDIEFVYEIAWTYSVIPVTSVTTDNDTVTVNMLARPFACIHDKTSASLQYQTNQTPHAIQNAIELLDAPDEWYFDRAANKMYYYPKDGKNPNEQSIIIPTLDKLVDVEGTAATIGKLDVEDDCVAAEYVYGIAFKDLAFRYTSYLQPHTEGWVEIQACFTAKDFPSTLFTRYKTEGALSFNYAQGIRIEGCSFSAFSSVAVDFGEGVSASTICNNNFEEIGASAIQVGNASMRDAQPLSSTYYENDVTRITNSDPDPWRVTKNIFVFSNRIYNIGTQFKGSIGIFGGYVTDLTISHNQISKTPYSGISIGWGWGEIDKDSSVAGRWGKFTTDSTQLRYVVENNDISDCLNRLTDGGGIYTLSNMPGSIIRGNVIYDIPTDTLKPAIYNDQASGGYVDMSENVSWDVGASNDYMYQKAGPQYNAQREAECHAMMDTYNFIDRKNAPEVTEVYPYSVVKRSGIIGGVPSLPDLDVIVSADNGEMVAVSGSVNWNHYGNGVDYQPLNATIKVFSGTIVVAQATVSQDENWEYSFKLPKTDGEGATVTYTVSADKIKGYNAVVSGNDVTYTYTGLNDFESLPLGTVTDLGYGKVVQGDTSIVDDGEGGKVLKANLATKFDLVFPYATAQKTVQYDFMHDAFNQGRVIQTQLRYTDSWSNVMTQMYPSNTSEQLYAQYYSMPENPTAFLREKATVALNKKVWYTYKSQLTENKLYIKIWPRDNAEPVEWTLIQDIFTSHTTDDGVLCNLRISSWNGPNGTGSVYFDNICVDGDLEPQVSDESCLKYTEENGSMVVSGCKSSAKGEIVIPSSVNGLPVTAIANGAFENCNGITAVVIPEGVKYIGDGAFKNCTSLKEVVIPEGVLYIGNEAFSGCTSLKRATLPESVYTIGEGAFKNCTALEYAYIPKNITELGNNAFDGCDTVKLVIESENSFVIALAEEKGFAHSTFEFSLGDINLDGRVDLVDLVRIKKYLANVAQGTRILSPLYEGYTDIDNSGVIDAADMTSIFNHIVYGTPFKK